MALSLRIWSNDDIQHHQQFGLSTRALVEVTLTAPRARRVGVRAQSPRLLPVRRPADNWAMSRPVVGITPDVHLHDGRERATCMLTYVDAVIRAGGTPLLLAPSVETAADQLAACDAVVLTGGDDPRTEAYGQPTHPNATPLNPRRQAFETRVLELLDAHPRPTLGVCLGMQMMALHAGGRLDQHMPDTRPDAGRHWGADHRVVPVESVVSHRGSGPKGGAGGRAQPTLSPTRLSVPPGTVHSKHKQAVDDPGRLIVLARSDDGVIEAIANAALPFYLGVQWHPERTTDDALGINLFRQLIEASDRSSPRAR